MHTAISLGKGEVADSFPRYYPYKSGPAIRDLSNHLSGKRFAVIRTGNQQIVNSARSLVTQMSDYSFGGFGMKVEGNPHVYCSQFGGKALKDAGVLSVYGIGPNTLYYNLKSAGY